MKDDNWLVPCIFLSALIGCVRLTGEGQLLDSAEAGCAELTGGTRGSLRAFSLLGPFRELLDEPIESAADGGLDSELAGAAALGAALFWNGLPELD